MSEQRDEQFAARAGDLLEQRAQKASEDVMERLRQARAAAVRVVDQPARRAWVPWSGAVAASVAMVALSLVLTQPDVPTDAVPEGLLSAEAAVAQEAELLEELEFVAWMASAEVFDENG